MKTAISLPDDLFVAAVTERLDAVYAVEESSVEKPLRRAQRMAVTRTEW